jgi:hypothetical protein
MDLTTCKKSNAGVMIHEEKKMALDQGVATKNGRQEPHRHRRDHQDGAACVE